ncbi:hypothetical protein E6A45_02810 [Brachyspira pilosicoli]|uniref:Lipocalin-like domain-containing protein n=2 Tax=Brachyspira pilosicoli TaxID=52584 RepID=A0A3B6VHS8_BRAPL|nr:hypothetical protein BPP43_00100 [Brachyspira pilosicoli P43/6/78]MBW5377571.1 hypothetical protein [Brachyspira pilosicoli]SUW04516.1 Uncharacterised protein [Brachyspira pilosicoli]
MNKKLLTIFSLLLIFFAMSCNNKTTDPVAPLKDSQYVGKWYEVNVDTPVFEIKQDGSIDTLNGTTVVATVNGTDVVKENDTTFKATFSANGQSQEVVFVFTSDTTGTVTASGQEGSTISIVKK